MPIHFKHWFLVGWSNEQGTLKTLWCRFWQLKAAGEVEAAGRAGDVRCGRRVHATCGVTEGAEQVGLFLEANCYNGMFCCFTSESFVK